ncbi:hypothetical protein GUJ93_ZPchr0010g7885 [Zizania palustris]|uniref:Uncharacterized protein n=1 Tax=Zizania palustris TaxID=103762 RepID=A0A8J5W967_ZIZPA|nr:hypothetical protein GUJ93_ZPchr0010g7885 [Zizania palustris]
MADPKTISCPSAPPSPVGVDARFHQESHPLTWRLLLSILAEYIVIPILISRVKQFDAEARCRDVCHVEGAVSQSILFVEARALVPI